MVEVGKDKEVMKYFPTLLTEMQTEEMLLRFFKHYEKTTIPTLLLKRYTLETS